MDGLMAEVVEGHIRDHVFRDARARSGAREAAADLIKIVRSYFK
jgi:DNA-binding FrmR family transcriptional regulator